MNLIGVGVMLKYTLVISRPVYPILVLSLAEARSNQNFQVNKKSFLKNCNKLYLLIENFAKPQIRKLTVFCDQ